MGAEKKGGRWRLWRSYAIREWSSEGKIWKKGLSPNLGGMRKLGESLSEKFTIKEVERKLSDKEKRVSIIF